MSGLAIEGYASLFWAPDHGDDVVAQGAFAESLALRPPARVQMLHQHDPAAVIGAWDEVKEDARGLFVRGRIFDTSPAARFCAALVKARALDGLSIGYRTLRARKDAASGVRRLIEVDLFEVSVVTFPMLPGARVESVKRAPLARTIRRAAAMLRRAAD